MISLIDRDYYHLFRCPMTTNRGGGGHKEGRSECNGKAGPSIGWDNFPLIATLFGECWRKVYCPHAAAGEAIKIKIVPGCLQRGWFSITKTVKYTLQHGLTHKNMAANARRHTNAHRHTHRAQCHCVFTMLSTLCIPLGLMGEDGPIANEWCNSIITVWIQEKQCTELYIY